MLCSASCFAFAAFGEAVASVATVANAVKLSKRAPFYIRLSLFLRERNGLYFACDS